MYPMAVREGPMADRQALSRDDLESKDSLRFLGHIKKFSKNEKKGLAIKNQWAYKHALARNKVLDGFGQKCFTTCPSGRIGVPR